MAHFLPLHPRDGSAWNADFMAGGYFTPIGDYMSRMDEVKEAWDDIIEQFRVLCYEWDGIQGLRSTTGRKIRLRAWLSSMGVCTDVTIHYGQIVI